MVATRKFDEDATLQAIMETFWRKRFSHTSIEDLETATGLRRGSLYNAFGGKEALFLLALGRYGETVQQPLFETLENKNLEDAVAGFFAAQIGSFENQAVPAGCLVANALAEVDCGEENLDAAVRGRLERTESVLYDRLVSAQAAGEIAPGSDVRAFARFLLAISLILPILDRISGDTRVVQDVARIALRALRP